MMTHQKNVTVFQLNNGVLSVDLLDLGASLHSLRVPDRNGRPTDVVIGFDDVQHYLTPHPSLNVTVGRFANRIRNSTFSLNEKTFTLPANEGPHHLHGGPGGFGWKFWQPSLQDDTSITFTMESPDGDQGYPGHMTAAITYSVQGHSLVLEYAATCSAPCPINLTNHAYFNLNGATSGSSIHDHIIRLEADQLVETGLDLMPTGRFLDVAGTPYDLRTPKALGDGIAQLAERKGYDICYALPAANGYVPTRCDVYAPYTGIVMETATSEPGLQLYTANYMDGSLKGKGGVTYTQHAAFCLETQNFPDAPNIPHFPSSLVHPGTLYRSRTMYRFSTR